MKATTCCKMDWKRQMSKMCNNTHLSRAVVLLITGSVFYFLYHHSIPDLLGKDGTVGGGVERSLNEEDYEVDWNTIKIREKPASHLLHDKWIVITTINPPTSDVKKLAAIPGWKVVIVGDKKSPKDWAYPNCIHLFVEDQLKLNYRVTKLLKFGSYARKTIGFLYAVQHGAKIIYETDDDNSPTAKEIGFDQLSKRAYQVYEPAGSRVMNPYAHFGQSTIWPRGYPLDKISEPNTFKYRRCSGKKALVQQGVVNGDPDVDAIFRLTRKNSDQAIDVTFDSASEPMMLPRGVMAPYNSQNTLHLYEAFWGLVLPQTVAFRVTDIWRGYWAQRLLWELNGYLTFFPPNAYTVRNSHSYLDDFIDERELYHLSSKLTAFLVSWESKKSNFFDRVLDLSLGMAKEGLWKADDVELIKLWLMDLVSLGFQIPKVSSSPPNQGCSAQVTLIKPKEQKTSALRTTT